MKFCKFCGEQVKETAKFCNHCGKSLEQTTDPEESVEAEEEQLTDDPKGSEQEEAQKEPKVDEQPSEEKEEVTATPVVEEKPVVPVTSEEEAATIVEVKNDETKQTKPKKKGKLKYLIISIAALVLIFVGAYVYGDYVTSAKHLLNDFETAVKDKDTKKLATLLTTEEKDLKITSDSLKSFVDLYEAQPSELKQLMNHLKNQTRKDTVDSVKMFTVDLIKDGKKYVIFDEYKLSLNPVYVNVSTNYKDTDIVANGEVILTTEKENFNGEVGPLIPGEYTIEASYDTGLFHITDEKNVKLINPGYPEYVSIYLEGDMVSFSLYGNGYDHLKKIEMLVNGKETGWNIAKEDRVGPLLTDGSMNVSFKADFPWGTVVTNEMPLTERYNDLDLGDSDEFKQLMMDKIIEFNEDFMELFTTGDVTIFTSSTDEFILSLLDEIVYNAIAGIEYQGIFHGVDFYLDSFELKRDYDGYWKVEVDTITYFEEGFYEKGDKPELEQIEDELRYELIYDSQGDEWIVSDLDHAGMMEEDRMERYTASDPELHKSDWAQFLEDAKKELEDMDLTDDLDELEQAIKELEEYLGIDSDEDSDKDKDKDKTDKDDDKKDKDKDKDKDTDKKDKKKD